MVVLERRRLLAAISTAAATTLAGCSDLLDSDPEDEDAPEGDDPADGTESNDEESPLETPPEIATTFVEELAAGRFERASERMTSSLGEVTPAVVERNWMGYTAVHGAFEEVVTTEEVDAISPGNVQYFERVLNLSVDDLDFVDVAIDFENGEDAMLVAIDEDDAIREFLFNGDYERPSYVDPDTFTEESVTVPAEGCPLEGTATVPTDATAENVPGVVIVHGSGPADENYESYGTQMLRDLAEGLASRGIAVLRYEKRTFRCTVDAADHTLDRVTVDDALVAIDELRGIDGVDPDRIAVAGHSMGGMAVPRIVARDGTLAGGIALAANARPMEDLFVEQFEHRATVGEHEWEALSQNLETIRSDAERIRNGDYDPGEIVLQYPGALWQSLEAYDQFGTARSTDVPLFFLQGSRDYQVSLEKDFELWRDELADRPATTFESYDGLDHRLMSGQGPSVPAEYRARNNVEAAVIDDLVDWIDGH